jgi:uncharacterized protein
LSCAVVHAPARTALTRSRRGRSAGGGAMASGADERLVDAAKGGDVKGIAAALLAGADPNAFEGTYNMSPLQQAAVRGRVAAIAALLAAGARLDGEDWDGNTPLMGTAQYSHIAAMIALLAAGADVHCANKLGFAALHYASMCGRLDAARLLAEAGARADVRNKEGERPIDMVRPPLARFSMRLRDSVTPLCRRVTLRRFACTLTSPTSLPSTHCSPPLRPGPAAGP